MTKDEFLQRCSKADLSLDDIITACWRAVQLDDEHASIVLAETLEEGDVR